MNKIHSAFAYVINLVNGGYGGNWKMSEAYADAAIEFALNEQECEQLAKLHESFMFLVSVHGIECTD